MASVIPADPPAGSLRCSSISFVKVDVMFCKVVIENSLAGHLADNTSVPQTMAELDAMREKSPLRLASHPCARSFKGRRYCFFRTNPLQARLDRHQPHAAPRCGIKNFARWAIPAPDFRRRKAESARRRLHHAPFAAWTDGGAVLAVALGPSLRPRAGKNIAGSRQERTYGRTLQASKQTHCRRAWAGRGRRAPGHNCRRREAKLPWTLDTLSAIAGACRAFMKPPIPLPRSCRDGGSARFRRSRIGLVSTGPAGWLRLLPGIQEPLRMAHFSCDRIQPRGWTPGASNSPAGRAASVNAELAARKPWPEGVWVCPAVSGGRASSWLGSRRG